ncbi:hypothetical protein [Citreimonas sp.]|uniref:hypothetical protein n=1 Tax=Citreimonas sp. TaxID=3036715 RepID=UPI004059B42B
MRTFILFNKPRKARRDSVQPSLIEGVPHLARMSRQGAVMFTNADLDHDVSVCLRQLLDALQAVTVQASFKVKLRKRIRYELVNLLEDAHAALTPASSSKTRVDALAKLVDFVLQDVRIAAEGTTPTLKSMDALCDLADAPLRCLRRCYIADVYDPSRMDFLVDRLVVADRPVI